MDEEYEPVPITGAAVINLRNLRMYCEDHRLRFTSSNWTHPSVGTAHCVSVSNRAGRTLLSTISGVDAESAARQLVIDLRELGVRIP
jgi:hypothetical protein